MTQFLIQLLIGWFAIFPIITLLHELGHGIVALAVVPKKQVSCVLGTDLRRSQYSLNIGQRLRILLNIGTGFFGIFWVEDYRQLEKSQLVLINLAGPLVSLVLAILFYLLPSSEISYVNVLRRLIWQWSLFQFLVTIIPIRYPRWWIGYANLRSDGLRTWHAIQGTP